MFSSSLYTLHPSDSILQSKWFLCLSTLSCCGSVRLSWLLSSLLVIRFQSTPFRCFLPPAVVSIGSVGFSHLVQLVLLLHHVALFAKGRQQLLGEFFIHVRASVFVVPALCDHPLHGEEAPPVVREWNGHLGGVRGQEECNYLPLCFADIRSADVSKNQTTKTNCVSHF